jgi:hypothetical protein
MARPYALVAGISVVCIVAIQVAIAYFAYKFLPDWPTRGQFGDVFGAANSLFSGLAFAGLIYTVLLQREELALQRKELELTRQELKRSAQAQEQAEVALRAQADAAARSARLSTATSLLAHYRSELRDFRGIALPAQDPRRVRMGELAQREQALLAVMDRMYDELTAARREG